MLFKILCIFAQCVLLSFAAETSQPSTQKQTVSVFYENLCPDSVKFFYENLYKSYVTSNIGEGINLILNTYGNSNTSTSPNGTYSFICEHGPDECHRNLIHACVIKNVQNISMVLNFVNCSLYDTYHNASKQPTEECAKRANIDVKSIYSCLNNPNGLANITLNEMGLQKKKFGIEQVPSVVFNDVYNQTISANAVMNFPEALCNFVETNNLSNDYCKAKKNSASIAAVSLLPIVIAAFLLTKMYQ